MTPMTSDHQFPVSPVAMIFAPPGPGSSPAVIQEGSHRKPVLLWRGQIVYGLDMYEGSLITGVEPIFEVLPDNGFPIERLMEEASRPGHMSKGQRAIAARKLWQLSSGGWAGLGLSEGDCVNLLRFSKREAASVFGVSVRLLHDADRLMADDGGAIPELLRAAEMGVVTVGAASKVAAQPPGVQLEVLELLLSSRVSTIAGAVKKVLQSAEEREDEPDPVLIERMAAGLRLAPSRFVLYHSPIEGLHGRLAPESVDAIVTLAHPTPEYHKMVPVLGRLAADVLTHRGVLLLLARAIHLPQLICGLKDSGLVWVNAPTVIFNEKLPDLHEEHDLSNRCMVLLIYSKGGWQLPPGGDMIGTRWPQQGLEVLDEMNRALRNVLQRYTRAGQLVLNPDMQGWAGVPSAARDLGRRFIGADREVHMVEQVARRLAMRELGIATTVRRTTPAPGGQLWLPFMDNGASAS